MILYDDPGFRVSQGFFRGWRIENKLLGQILVPNPLQTERIGFVWMMVRRTKRKKSIYPKLSETLMFQSFATAVMWPDSDAAELWMNGTPDEIADLLIWQANREVRDAHEERQTFVDLQQSFNELSEEQKETNKGPDQKGPSVAKPAHARHSEQNTVENTEVEIRVVKAKRTQLVEALKRTTKMKRAPAGARSSGLKEGAFVPELVGFRVEMPGGSSLVVLDEGRLEREVVFLAAKMEPVRKVLSSYQGDDDIVQIGIGENFMVFRCGSSKLTIPIIA